LLADGVQRGNWRGAVFVRIEKNIVPIRIRGPETDDGACGKPVAVDDALQHGLRIGIQAARRLAGFWIVQNLREWPDQLPGPEEGPPIDVARELGQIVRPEIAQAEKARLGR